VKGEAALIKAWPALASAREKATDPGFARGTPTAIFRPGDGPRHPDYTTWDVPRRCTFRHGFNPL
jgi:hypothetical protein